MTDISSRTLSDITMAEMYALPSGYYKFLVIRDGVAFDKMLPVEPPEMLVLSYDQRTKTFLGHWEDHSFVFTWLQLLGNFATMDAVS